jgi:NADPH:quinone reductase-like Zn-dependent oxidoreductase
VKPGDKVLVNGSGGGVGMFSVQIAKALEAGKVIIAVSGQASLSR